MEKITFKTMKSLSLLKKILVVIVCIFAYACIPNGGDISPSPVNPNSEKVRRSTIVQDNINGRISTQDMIPHVSFYYNEDSLLSSYTKYNRDSIITDSVVVLYNNTSVAFYNVISSDTLFVYVYNPNNKFVIESRFSKSASSNIYNYNSNGFISSIDKRYHVHDITETVYENFTYDILGNITSYEEASSGDVNIISIHFTYYDNTYLYYPSEYSNIYFEETENNLSLAKLVGLRFGNIANNLVKTYEGRYKQFSLPLIVYKREVIYEKDTNNRIINRKDYNVNNSGQIDFWVNYFYL